MQSEDEESDSRSVPGEEDEEVDEFPELDVDSDTEEEESGEGGSDEGESDDSEEGESDEGEESESESEGFSDDSLHVFPKAKVITSKITGQPKRVYPEIEPDYDSDSSTEEVGYEYGSVITF